MNLQIASGIANRIVEDLAPHCVRIEIKGSICRLKADNIHDIEIVCIPKPPDPLVFGCRPTVSPLHAYTDDLLALKLIAHRRDKNGRKAWGDKFRRILWRSTPFDLFITTPEQWGVIATIRTGSKAFSHRLVTPVDAGGWMPEGMCVEGGRLWVGSEAASTPEELDFFTVIGKAWVEPKDR